MPKFNFDRSVDRLNTYCCKWDADDTTLPMWIADMDFETAPCVKDAIVKRAMHGVFGYSYVPDELFSAVSDFWYKRHGYRFDTADMVYSAGVVAAVSSLVRKLTTPAEKVLIQAPVYNIFYNSILNNGRQVISNDLVIRDGKYEIDFEDMERKLEDTQTTLFILCNPHNPVGKTYTKEELCRMGELCKKHGVTVISDEIHCEFTYPKNNYTPFAAAGDDCKNNSVTLLSGSKAFNIAGLSSAVAVAHNPHLKARVFRSLNTDEVGEPNAFAVQANLAAFTDGAEWLDELVDYLNDNKRFATEYVKENIPKLKLYHSDATYLLWADISELGIHSAEFTAKLKDETGLYISAGSAYGTPGNYFVRINLATQRENVKRGLEILKNYIANI